MMLYTQLLARPRLALHYSRSSSSRWPSRPLSCLWAQSFSSSKANGDDESDDQVVEIVASDERAVTRRSDHDQVLNYPHVVVVPALRRPLFPGVVLPLTITNNPELSQALMSLKESNRPYVGVFLQKESSKTTGTLEDFYSVGSFARIDNILSFDQHSTQVLMVAQRRIKMDELYEHGPPLRVKIHALNSPDEVLESTERLNHDDSSKDEENQKLIKAYSNEIVATLREVVKLNPLFKEHMTYFAERIDIHNPYKLADFAASVTTSDALDLQHVLEEMNVTKRLTLALELITKELELSRVQQQIKEQVEAKVSANQRRYILLEQLKTIKQELGLEKDDKETLVTKYRARIDGLKGVPVEAAEVMQDELAKLEMLEKNSSEFNISRHYLDWLTLLPWQHESVENLDLAKAKAILDEDHYGLSDIKERILEFMAVSKLKQSVQGKILCFVGPPGVGKTSIGQSIARALNREFYRFSVGGLSDVAEIKGHRRTYVGAMPGKLIQCLKLTQTSNPLILIDEIDKLGRGGHQGDPASALLELLDPNQNGSFVDHYLDVPVNLSKVLFICTANVMDSIPGPLLDRMEILRLSGYDQPEKLAIAQEYLIPKALCESGLTNNNPESSSSSVLNIDIPHVTLTEGTINRLIRQYCREAGVRNLQHQIEKILRKVALKVVSASSSEKKEELTSSIDHDSNYTITTKSLEEFVGQPTFTSDRMYEQCQPGVVMGLAWTAMGGSSLYIETTTVPSNSESSGGKLSTTGQMGSVMEESTRIAHTFARHFFATEMPNNAWFCQSDVHLHVPEGATPKDGPSAGCTMVTALLSLAMNRPVVPDLAMTGEISLIGKVLPVGGIKEKVIAARRASVKILVLPEANQKDFHELPEYLKTDLEVHFADYYADVYHVAFPQEESLTLV